MSWYWVFGVGAAAWLAGYLYGYGVGREGGNRDLLARQADLERQLADLQRTVDAVDWLYSPEDLEDS